MERVVILTGAAGSGKDTAAEAICEGVLNAWEAKFSAPLKDLCCDLFGWDRERIDDDLGYKQSLAQYPDGRTVKYGQEGLPWTKRQLMQLVGTEMFRDMVHEDIWARMLIRNLEKDNCPGDTWVISDCRFSNEYEVLKEAFDEVLVVQLQRQDSPTAGDGHSSEQGWQTIPADVTIFAHNGALDQIREEAVAAVRTFTGDVSV